MASYRLVSNLEQTRTVPKSPTLVRLWRWLKKETRPSVPNKPMSQMTPDELDRISDI